jgi:chromosome segregation ATPase
VEEDIKLKKINKRLRECQKEKEEVLNEANKVQKEKMHCEARCRDLESHSRDVAVIFLTSI